MTLLRSCASTLYGPRSVQRGGLHCEWIVIVTIQQYNNATIQQCNNTTMQCNNATIQQCNNTTMQCNRGLAAGMLLHHVYLEVRYEVGRDAALRLDPGAARLALGLDLPIVALEDDVEVVQDRHLGH